MDAFHDPKESPDDNERVIAEPIEPENSKESGVDDIKEVQDGVEGIKLLDQNGRNIAKKDGDFDKSSSDGDHDPFDTM